MLSLDLNDPAHSRQSFVSSADADAARCWAANLRALVTQQKSIVQQVQSLGAGVMWIYGRDGSLTAQHPDGKWLDGCSLPRRAAAAMLQSLDVTGVTACFLSPTHAAQIRAALDRLSSQQAIIAIVPHPQTLRIILGCDDFSTDIAAGRLWFACERGWADELDRLFEQHPGLPTPARFIRMPMLAEQEMNALIEPAQRVFARQNTARSAKVRELIEAAPPPRRGVLCVIASSRFELWNTAGEALADALGPQTKTPDPLIKGSGVFVRRFDPASPANASPLALAAMIAGAGAVVSANLARADLPDVAPAGLPWITWVTARRIPRTSPGATNDAIVLADARWRDLAIQQGWRDSQVHIASWPAMPEATDPTPTLALIADTCPTTPPKADAMPLSSHRLMWEHIAAELADNPLAACGDVHAYLSRTMQKFSISEQGLDRQRFIERLIVPAWQQGIAAILLNAGLPLRIHGRGWESVPAAAGAHRGIIQSHDELAQAIHASAALVHPSPVDDAHPIDGASRPVLRPVAGMNVDSLVAQARQLLSTAPSPIPRPDRTITHSLIQDILYKQDA